MSDELNQSTERPVTVGYLKLLFDQLQLSDDAVLYHNDAEGGWLSVGPEGQEIMFLTTKQIAILDNRAEKLHEDCNHSASRSWCFGEVAEQFKKEIGQ